MGVTTLCGGCSFLYLDFSISMQFLQADLFIPFDSFINGTIYKGGSTFSLGGGVLFDGRALINRVEKLKTLEMQMKELDEQIEALKADIKKDMEHKMQ